VHILTPHCCWAHPPPPLCPPLSCSCWPPPGLGLGDLWSEIPLEIH
jgi:hypothetical protein